MCHNNVATAPNFKLTSSLDTVLELMHYFLFSVCLPLMLGTAALQEEERIQEMERLLHDELPQDNYIILKYLMQFLTEVSMDVDIMLRDDGPEYSISSLSCLSLRQSFGPRKIYSNLSEHWQVKDASIMGVTYSLAAKSLKVCLCRSAKVGISHLVQVRTEH